MTRRIAVGLSAVILTWAVLVRVLRLGWPPSKVFDEVYFPIFANAFLHHRIIFDVHPPLGKFLIAIGIWLFGFNPFGWRIIVLLFGLATPLLFALWWYRWQQDKVGAWLIACYTALDGALIVYSRLGLMDGLLLFFIFLTLTVASRAKNEFWPAVFLGLAVSIKWIGLGILVPIAYLAWRRGRIWQLLAYLPLSIAIYCLIVYFGQLIGGTPHPWIAAWTWNLQAMHYQLTLQATHPWSSPYWSWPLLLRPVLLYYQPTKEGISLLTTLGNPLLWWSSSLAVVASIFYLITEKPVVILDHPLTLLLVGWFSFFLPFAVIKRVLFIYHYLPAYGFALGMLTWWTLKVWRRFPWLVLLWLAIILSISFYFTPFWIGWPLSASVLRSRIWLYSWLY